MSLLVYYDSNIMKTNGNIKKWPYIFIESRYKACDIDGSTIIIINDMPPQGGCRVNKTCSETD